MNETASSAPQPAASGSQAASGSKKILGYSPAKRLPFVANVSWPRSGHVLLSRVLLQTFGGVFGYCEFYGPKKLENSPCCATFPCQRRGRIHMTKQHDFGFKAELPSDHRLIVQYRAFLPAVVSHFEQNIATSNRNENTAECFREFAVEQADNYKQFLDKWVRSERTNRLLLRYEDLTANPAAALREVLDLFKAPEYAPAMERVITKIDGLSFADGEHHRIRGAGIANRRDIEEFRFYDAPFFDELAAMVGEDPR